MFAQAVAVLAGVSMELDDWRAEQTSEEKSCDIPLSPALFERQFADEAVEALTAVVTSAPPVLSLRVAIRCETMRFASRAQARRARTTT